MLAALAALQRGDEGASAPAVPVDEGGGGGGGEEAGGGGGTAATTGTSAWQDDVVGGAGPGAWLLRRATG